jgi:hypothetical protein
MHKILIVGHPQAGHADVERLLHAHGMTPALPSRREGFSPEQISSALDRAHALRPATDLRWAERGAQALVQPGPVWHGMALDLLLGNLDQALWGWCDPDALPWLGFWHGLDPALQFILVYDRPGSIVSRLPAGALASLCPDRLHQGLRHWTRYNAALLDFFQAHSDRCLLVHSARARETGAAWLQTVKSRMPAPWRDQPHQATLPLAAGTEGTAAHHPGPVAQTERIDDTPPGLDPRVLRMVADHLLRQDTDSQRLYASLQSCAQWPALPTHDDPDAVARAAWQGLQAQHRRWRELSATLGTTAAARDAAERLAEQRHAHIEDQRRRSAEAEQAHAAQLAALTEARDQQRRCHLAERAQWRVRTETARQQHARHAAESLETLNALADTARAEHLRLEQALAQTRQSLTQLQQQQAEQEARWQRRLDEVQSAERQARERLQAEARDLRMRATLAPPTRSAVAPNDGGDALRAENEWMLDQLHELQREIERLERGAPREPQSADGAPPPVLFGAAERVREGLDYRIGAAMIRHARSPLGWLRLPGAVLAEVGRHQWRRWRSPAGPRPPLQAYRDAHEGERTKLHLSYRLGHVTLANAWHPIGWLRLPFALARELRAFRARQRLSPLGHMPSFSDTHA